MKDPRSVVENAPTYNENVGRREWNEDTATQKLMLFNAILGTLYSSLIEDVWFI
jgi:hypothetical protein